MGKRKCRPGLDLRPARGKARHRRTDPPFPPRKEISYLSIPLLTFFTPLAPIRLFPGQNCCPQFANRGHLPVSPLGSGQISGQLFRLSPRSAVALLATTGLGSRPKSRPALGLLADSHRVCGRFRASTLPILPTILITQGESPNFIFTH